MAKTLAEKIDFLMTLTNTRNSELGRALHFDASYISRIRSGKRGLPKGQPFVEPASIFFAHGIHEEYQKAAAAQELNLIGPWPKKEKEAAKLISGWLQSQTPQPAPIDRMLAAITSPAISPKADKGAYRPGEGNQDTIRFFYGNEGKRSAVIQFLERLASTGEALHLLLYSDEDMDWLYEDPDFPDIWAAYLIKLIENGSSIRIIHSIGRSLNEMWEAVQKWLPLYMTGAIEPYYYPMLRDGVFRRTMFVAQGRAALISNSVKDQKGEVLNTIITEPRAVDVVEGEFDAYFTFCKPLMEIAKLGSRQELEDVGRKFRDLASDLRTEALPGVDIMLKDNTAALFLKTDPPYIAFMLKEPRMLAALEEYIKSINK
ncbi:MAG: hypothetical protein IJM69_01980 [Firmicutes bacterium]|nr:hypothetical protein [Bacillota bacterium]